EAVCYAMDCRRRGAGKRTWFRRASGLGPATTEHAGAGEPGGQCRGAEHSAGVHTSAEGVQDLVPDDGRDQGGEGEGGGRREGRGRPDEAGRQGGPGGVAAAGTGYQQLPDRRG